MKKKTTIVAVIALSVLIINYTQAGFDPVPKKYNRHPASQPDFGKPTAPKPLEAAPEKTEADIAEDIANEIVPPLDAVSHLVNQPPYERHQLDTTIDVSKIASWEVMEISEKQTRIVPVIVADKNYEINLSELTAIFEGEGTLEAELVYYYSNDLKKAIEKKSFTGFKKIVSGKKVSFSNRYKSARYVWIVLSAKGKIKLTGLTHSCNTVKNGLYGHIPREYRFAHGSLQYRILYPHNYDPNRKYTLVIGVHGSGGVGSDNRKSMEMTNLARFLYTSYYMEPELECFSIVPQIPDDKSIPAPYYPNGNTGVYSRTYHPAISLSAVNATGWYTQATLTLVHEMLKSSELSIDPDRVYYTGFSYGGKACWEFLKADPELFAGAVCVAGWPIGMPYQAPNEIQFEQLKKEVAGYKDVPVYITAGERDGMRLGSKVVYEEILNQGGKSIYKEIPGADHVGSAIKTWSDSEIVKWLFEQRK